MKLGPGRRLEVDFAVVENYPKIICAVERRPGHRFIAQVLKLCGLAIDGDGYEFESVYEYPSSTGR